MKYILVTILCCLGLGACLGRGGGKSLTAERPRQASVRVPERYSYRIAAVHPHDPSSYTQGLYWDRGRLYEGTGLYGESALLETDPATGKALRRESLPAELFGEGIARLGDTIYQLTWQEGRALLYDAATFRRIGEFRYPGEGWGLTTDGSVLYASDGTSRIRVLDPRDFSVKREIFVIAEGRAQEYLNELEWIGGELWANVYMTDLIVRIDPATGEVTGVIDLTGLLPEADRTPQTDVLNGIAWDRETGRIFVTGKRWSKLFEIEPVGR